MSHTFLLIHGAWHGAWCWNQLIESLSQQGHNALAIDLPGHGAESKPGWHIGMQSYVDAVNDAAAKAASNTEGKVHLVGHSMGGTVVSCAAEQNPELYASLTYVAAFLLPSGKSLISAGAEMDAPMMKKAVNLPNLFRGYCKVNPNHTKAAFYNRCEEKDARNASALVCAQSLRPLNTKVVITEARWSKLPRYYVFCEDDQAIPIEGQRKFVEQLPCQKTVSLNTDHSPFISDTARLAEALADFAADAELE